MTKIWLSQLPRPAAWRTRALFGGNRAGKTVLVERMFVRRFGRKPAGNITGCTYTAGNWPGLAQIHTDLGGMVWKSKRDPFVRVRSNNPMT